MNDVTDLTSTIIPKSDQLNADDLLPGSMTITVTSVSRGAADQPIVINYVNDNGRPYKPCKSMRRILITAWGKDGSQWAGKSMTLFNDKTVKWAGQEVGGIRIAALSHIQQPISVAVTVAKGKRVNQVIEVLQIADYKKEREALETAAALGIEALKKTWEQTPPNVKQSLGGKEYIEKLKEKADGTNRMDN